jgi:hypothetical protein
MDAMILEKVAQKANELTATYDEKFRNYEDRYQFDSIFREDSAIKVLLGSRTYSASLPSQKLTYEIYGFLMNPIKQDFWTIVKNKVGYI